MKTLLLVTDAWRPQTNGVVAAYEKMCEGMRQRGYKVVVIHPGLFKTIPLPFYPEIRLALFPRRRLRQIFTREKPDFVHIPVPGTLGLAGRALCKEKEFLFTTCYHTHIAHYIDVRLRYFFKPAYAFLRWFHNSGSATMAATEGLMRELEAHGFTNVVLWPLGVDTELFQRNPAPALPSLTKPVFVYMGRIAIEKSLDEFLDADLPGTKLIIGDGPDRARLERKYSDRAMFVGYKRGQELVDWLSLCDVFVFPSRTETFGLAIIEALAVGLPVAAHDCMGPRDIITHGVDGYLSEDLQGAALKCLTLNRDACRNKALRYSWERSAAVFESLLVPVRRASSNSA